MNNDFHKLGESNLIVLAFYPTFCVFKKRLSLRSAIRIRSDLTSTVLARNEKLIHRWDKTTRQPKSIPDHRHPFKSTPIYGTWISAFNSPSRLVTVITSPLFISSTASKVIKFKSLFKEIPLAGLPARVACIASR